MVDDFDGFYQAHFADTVSLAYSHTADLGEAQDIAQEAFCRAWQRWQELSTYDNPVAWVRRVALNLAHSRWRRVKVAAAHLVRQRIDETPALDPDHVAVVAALRKLPVPQREAIVLHHMMDLPLSEVAEHFDVPVGTVKSWLHRGRAALAGDLAIDVRKSVAVPPAREVVRLAKTRRRARNAVLAVVMIALLVVAVASLQLIRHQPDRPPVNPNPSPTLSCSDAVDLTIPEERNVRLNVYGGTDQAGLDQDAARELRNRKFNVEQVAPAATLNGDVVAVIRYGPGETGAAWLLQGYLNDQAIAEFDPASRDGVVDLILGPRHTGFASPIQVRHLLDYMGQPKSPC